MATNIDTAALMTRLRRAEMDALKSAYSDAKDQIKDTAKKLGCSVALARHMLVLDRLAMHEGTSRIVEAEIIARRQQEVIAE